MVSNDVPGYDPHTIDLHGRASIESTDADDLMGGFLKRFTVKHAAGTERAQEIDGEVDELEHENGMATPDSPVLGYGVALEEPAVEADAFAAITDYSTPPFNALDDAEHCALQATTPKADLGHSSSRAWKPRGPSGTVNQTAAITSEQPVLTMTSDAELSSVLAALTRPERSQSHMETLPAASTALDIDPSLFPDPYPSQPWNSPLPALSSGSSNSARSSAYTSPGSILRHSGDSGNINVAVVLPDNPNSEEIGLGITADERVQIPNDISLSTASRAPILTKADPDAVIRLNKANTMNSRPPPFVSRPPRQSSFDTSWNTEEKEELAISTDDETDDDDKFDTEGDSFDSFGSLVSPLHNIRTEAAVIAEEGRGTIVNGERLPVHQIPLVPGVTHLLLSSSSTPNSLPPFLMTTLTNVSGTLLALDISANFLMSLPASLSTLSVLEELNVSSNPLRALPTFLASLHRSLRILVADSAQLTGLPFEMACMRRLSVLSLRRNKLHGIPDCIASMDALEHLRIDGNVFLGPWKTLAEPFLQTSSITSVLDANGTSDQLTGMSSAFSVSDEEPSPNALEEEHTIRASLVSNASGSRPLPRSFTAPLDGEFLREREEPQDSTVENSTSLTRTRTIPNRPTYQRSAPPDTRQVQTRSQYQESNVEHDASRPSAMRRMRSANELRDSLRSAQSKTDANGPRNRTPTVSTGSSITHRHPSDARSESMFVSTSTPPTEMASNKFGSVKLSTHFIQEAQIAEAARLENRGIQRDHGPIPDLQTVVADVRVKRQGEPSHSSSHDEKRDASKSKWGFFKKMSMRSLKGPDGQPSSSPMRHRERPSISQFMSTPTVLKVGETPEIEGVSVSAGNSRATSPLAVPTAGPSLADLLSEDLSVKTPSGPTLSPVGQSPLSPANRRLSFLPIDGPSTLIIPPPISQGQISSPTQRSNAERDSAASGHSESMTPEQLERKEMERLARAKRVLFAYLQDMLDLNPAITPIPAAFPNITQPPIPPPSPLPGQPLQDQSPDRSSKMRRPTISDIGGRVLSDSSFSSASSTVLTASALSFRDAESGISSNSASLFTSDSDGARAGPSVEERKTKDDRSKRVRIIREIVETERTYVKGLQELMDIYIRPAAMTTNVLGGSSKETVVPVSERKAVFSGLDGLYHFHQENFLPALETAAAPLIHAKRPLEELDHDGQLSSSTAVAVAEVFLSHAAFMKMYSSYINNFDSATQHLRSWTVKATSSAGGAGSPPTPGTPGLGIAMAGVIGAPASDSAGASTITTAQRKRIKSYLKRCRLHPKHSQLNLEGYLLLPVQRIPRYRLLLEDLVRNTPPRMSDGREDALDRALCEISSLAVNMNEGKRDSESRRKLVQWQSRIRGKFPSPLVQPHRRMIMEGPLHLTRVVRRNSVPFEILTADGDATDVHVDCLTPEETPRDLIGILCNDLLVLCKDPSRGQNATSLVDLWAVLRMQTLAQPASVVHGSTLRLVDNKAILYFEAPSTSDALTWSRAINLHIPASKI